MSNRWDDLWELANSQDGLFHVRDARERGISDSTLSLSRQVDRHPDFRGVHRFNRANTSRWHTYIAAFIWSRGAGVISHGSALEIWELSDWLPTRADMILPQRWKYRMIPDKIRPYFADLPDTDTQWFESFRITTPRRSVDDFITLGVRLDLARQAVEQATARGRPGGALFHRHELRNLHMLTRAPKIRS